MNKNHFAEEITLQEGGKESISIAQVKEVMRLINRKTNGVLYKVIELMED